MKKSEQGFTLIELLVVIAIVGLLAGILVVSLTSARTKAKDAKRMADKRQVIGALNLALNASSSATFPSSGGVLSCLGLPSSQSCFSGGYSGNDTVVTALSTYLATFPKNNADAGTFAYDSPLYQAPYTFQGQLGALLVWIQDRSIPTSDCPSPFVVQHWDKYYYCYEFIPQ